jgi:FtsH-binding integral membrane protein
MSSIISCKYFIAKTFAHTAAGVGIAAISAEYPVLFNFLKKELGASVWSTLIIFITSFALIWVIPSLEANTPLKYMTATLFVYLIGQLSGIFIQRLDEQNILARTLFLATGVFVGMVAMGIYDKNNLLGFGPYLFGALIGFIIAQTILFILTATTTIQKQEYFQGRKILSFFGVALFSLFAAYDTQVIKVLARKCKKRGDYINASLGLFMDFVSLFQNMGIAGMEE